MGTVRSTDGTTIAYDRHGDGDGPPVILVDGATQHRAIDPETSRMARLLAPRFTVFRYDRRGRGDSGDTQPWAVQREVEDIEALIAEAGGRAALYGMSSGAALALEAAASGAPVTRLALYEPPFTAESPGMEPGPDTPPPSRYADLAASGRRGEAVELFMAGVGAPPEAIAGMRRSPAWPLLESVAHTLAYDLTIMGDSKVPVARAAAVKVPVLVIDGGDSPPWAGDAASALAAALPDARRTTLPGQTHQVDVEVLAPVLAGFFGGAE